MGFLLGRKSSYTFAGFHLPFVVSILPSSVVSGFRPFPLLDIALQLRQDQRTRLPLEIHRDVVEILIGSARTTGAPGLDRRANSGVVCDAKVHIPADWTIDSSTDEPTVVIGEISLSRGGDLSVD